MSRSGDDKFLDFSKPNQKLNWVDRIQGVKKPRVPHFAFAIRRTAPVRIVFHVQNWFYRTLQNIRVLPNLGTAGVSPIAYQTNVPTCAVVVKIKIKNWTDLVCKKIIYRSTDGCVCRRRMMAVRY